MLKGFGIVSAHSGRLLQRKLSNSTYHRYKKIILLTIYLIIKLGVGQTAATGRSGVADIICMYLPKNTEHANSVLCNCYPKKLTREPITVSHVCGRLPRILVVYSLHPFLREMLLIIRVCDKRFHNLEQSDILFIPYYLRYLWSLVLIPKSKRVQPQFSPCLQLCCILFFGVLWSCSCFMQASAILCQKLPSSCGIFAPSCLSIDSHMGAITTRVHHTGLR
jgi:hypothetical protein